MEDEDDEAVGKREERRGAGEMNEESEEPGERGRRSGGGRARSDDEVEKNEGVDRTCGKELEDAEEEEQGEGAPAEAICSSTLKGGRAHGIGT